MYRPISEIPITLLVPPTLIQPRGASNVVDAGKLVLIVLVATSPVAMFVTAYVTLEPPGAQNKQSSNACVLSLADFAKLEPRSIFVAAPDPVRWMICKFASAASQPTPMALVSVVDGSTSVGAVVSDESPTNMRFVALAAAPESVGRGWS